MWAIMTEVKVCEFTKSVCAAEWVVTSGSKRSRIFTSLTLLCATMKQRPCRDTEMFNYSMPFSINHKYHVKLISILLRKKISLFYLFLLQTRVKLIRYQDYETNGDKLIDDHSSSRWSEVLSGVFWSAGYWKKPNCQQKLNLHFVF